MATNSNRTVEILRETFTPLVERLTPETEPATIYNPVTTEPSTPVEEDDANRS